MHQLPNGVVPIVNLPGAGSLLSRSWKTYSQIFPQLIHLMILFAIGALVNVLLSGLLAILAQNPIYALQVLYHILLILLSLVTALYYSYIFSAMLYLIHGWAQGKALSVPSSLELAKSRFQSLFWVGILLSLAISGAAIITVFYPAGAILPFLFSIWYYFCIYIVLFDEERGVRALAKSRYLVHGIFWKVIGRYTAITAILFLLFILAYFTLLIQGIGWILFIVLAACFAFFIFPYLAVYEYYRYEDLVLLKRGVEFIDFQGERVVIRTWTILGFVFLVISWTLGMITPKMQQSLLEKFSLQNRILMYQNTVGKINENSNIISGYLEKLNFVKPQVAPPPTSLDDNLRKPLGVPSEVPQNK